MVCIPTLVDVYHKTDNINIPRQRAHHTSFTPQLNDVVKYQLKPSSIELWHKMNRFCSGFN